VCGGGKEEHLGEAGQQRPSVREVNTRKNQKHSEKDQKWNLQRQSGRKKSGTAPRGENFIKPRNWPDK